MTTHSIKRGLTLVEFCVIVFVVVILVGLLLPAVRVSHTPARRMSCGNNLKQIALACHNYYDTFNAFPPGWSSSADDPDGPMWSWGTAILPFLEQGPLYDKIQAEESSLAWAVENRLALMQAPIAAFRCPSDVGPETNTEPYRCFGPNQLCLATTNYLGVNNASRLFAGDADIDDPGRNGIFRKNFACRMKDIPDGTASTLMYGERVWQFKAQSDEQWHISGAGVVFGVPADSSKHRHHLRY